MKFGFAYAAYLFLLIPVFIVFMLLMQKKRENTLLRFSDKELIPKIAPYSSTGMQRFRIWLYALIFTSFIFSLAEPQMGTKMREIKRRGVDIIIALDTSLSMLAEDIKPNRMAKAKRELISFINTLKGDRIGIIAFSGKAFLQCPLTLDYNAAKMFLGIIDAGLVPVPGTALGDAVSLAVKSFSRKERRHKVLILLTDGEDHSSQPERAAVEAKKEGIRIYTIGIGTTQGEPIPIRDASGNITGYKKDRKGETVLSKLDEMTLQKIALACDGKYYRSTAGEIEVEKIYEEINGMEKKELQSKLYAQYEDRFQFPLVLCLIFMLIDLVYPERKRPMRPGAAVLIAVTSIFLFSGTGRAAIAGKIDKGNKAFNNKDYQEALNIYRDAQVDAPESHELHFNLGDALYENRKYEDALKEFDKATFSEDTALQAKSYYNMGNSLYRTGKLAEAIQYYKKSLEIDPEDKDAKYNIEFIQRLLKENMKKEKSDQSEQGNGQNASGKKKDPSGRDKKEQEQKEVRDGKRAQSIEENGEKMSEEEAMSVLDALQEDEKEALKERARRSHGLPSTGEDW